MQISFTKSEVSQILVYYLLSIKRFRFIALVMSELIEVQ